MGETNVYHGYIFLHFWTTRFFFFFSFSQLIGSFEHHWIWWWVTLLSDVLSIFTYVYIYICFLVWWHFNQVCKKLIQKDRMSSHFLWSSKILFHARFSIKSQFEKLRWTEHCTPKYERKNYYNRLLVYISPTCARHTEGNSMDGLKNDKPRENSIFRGIKSVTAVNLLSTRRGEARGVKISAEKLCSRERERSRAGCLLRNSRGETKITGTEPGGKANTPYP